MSFGSNGSGREPDPPPDLLVDHAKLGATHVMSIKGEIDISTASTFETELTRAGDAKSVVVDLSKCRYLDSSAISAIFRVHRKTGGRMRLVVTNKMVRRVVEVTKLDTVIPVYSSLEEALAVTSG